MKLQDKIKRRLDLYLGLIKQRKEIKNLYNSFDETEKNDFGSILKFNLVRSSRPYFLIKERSQNYNFYNPAKNLFIFEKHIFRSKRIEQDSKKEKLISEVIQDCNTMIREILIDRVYENGEVRVEPEDIVLDCGANIGIFSIQAAQKAKMVYAFEPSEEEAASLSENKKLNTCNNIKIIPRAVLDASKNAKLSLAGTASHFLTDKDNKDGKVIDVKTISIDEFVKEENLAKVDFIKMDIEGSEDKALSGAKETLRKFKPKLAITIYHKFSDFYQLPLLIKRLNPDYKLKVKNKKGTLMAYAI
jgi:FkbM family methyltransferase